MAKKEYIPVTLEVLGLIQDKSTLVEVKGFISCVVPNSHQGSKDDDHHYNILLKEHGSSNRAVHLVCNDGFTAVELNCYYGDRVETTVQGEFRGKADPRRIIVHNLEAGLKII